ncbi:hypothetical protein [Streptomyces sp. NPDC057293]|uniref:hypothetical protein n=1 Tax=unclassified Streptomyces TaxID=2593676 RepID=UPI003641519C
MTCTTGALMIEYVPRSGPPEAMNCPAVVCDTCRKQVVGSGNIVWAYKVIHGDDEVRQQSPLYAAHKGRCDQALDTWLKKQYGSGWLILWEELDTFARQFQHNTANAFADDSAGEYHQLVIKQPNNDPHSKIPQI